MFVGQVAQMMGQIFGKAAPWAAAFAMLALGACTSASSGEGGGNTFSNFLLFGGATVPPAAPSAAIEVPDCPPVDVAEGGAALRTLAGKSAEASAVRSQLSISNVARECVGQKDGSVVVKVGVEGRALAGPGGSISRSDVPVYIVLKRGDRVLVSRVRRAPVSVAPGDIQGAFILVEDGMVVPPGIGGEFEIQVGLGAPPAGGAAAPRKRSRG
jgi:hypothetical protein